MNKFTAVSFFCGAGGMDLGFIQAGFEIKAAWDWDNYAVQSYYENIGDHVNQMDIKEMTYDDIPKADVWLFGFPCQDLSVAGKQKGLYEGERSSMFFHVMRLLQEVREIEPENLPSIIMAENVKGLKPYLGALEEEYAKQGYKMQFQLFNSKYWGVPQNRERYFVVGVREDLPQTFEFLEEQKEYIPKLSSVLETEVDEKYYVSDEKAADILSRFQFPKGEVVSEPLKFLDRNQNVLPTYSMCLDTAQTNGVAIPHGTVIGTKDFGKSKAHTDVCPTLLATDYKEPKLTIIEEPQIVKVGDLSVDWNNDRMKRVFSTEGISPTVTTDTGGWTQIKVLDESKYRVRKLTPREYMRLQGFPEDYRIVVSNTQMYKQMGNAVTVPKAKGTALKIKEYLEGLK